MGKEKEKKSPSKNEDDTINEKTYFFLFFLYELIFFIKFSVSGHVFFVESHI